MNNVNVHVRTVGHTVLGVACDCHCFLCVCVFGLFLYSPSLNAFLFCLGLVCFSVQRAKLWCVPKFTLYKYSIIIIYSFIHYFLYSKHSNGSKAELK